MSRLLTGTIYKPKRVFIQRELKLFYYIYIQCVYTLCGLCDAGIKEFKVVQYRCCQDIAGSNRGDVELLELDFTLSTLRCLNRHASEKVNALLEIYIQEKERRAKDALHHIRTKMKDV